MLIQDLRFAIRNLQTRPGFTVVAVLTLAMGIGATTAIFGVVRAVLLRPLEYPEPARLVKVSGFDVKDGELDNLSPADFLDFQREATSFERMGANGYVGLSTVAGGTGDAERVGAVNVTEGFFPTLGVQPALGRLFLAEEDRPNGPRAVILSDAIWRSRFGADPGIVGKPVMVNAAPATVVGVLPASFRHIEVNPDRPADLFMTFRFPPVGGNRGGHYIRGVGRLKAGASIEQARAELETIARRLEQQYPVDNTDHSVHLAPLLESIVHDARPALVLLAVAVGLVLLVSCANVANLLLARGTGRLRELALRAALGADRGRLIRQMLTESAVLGIAGGVLGLVFATWATRGLAVLAAESVPRADQIGVDGVVLAFALAASLVTSVVFGLLPALHFSGRDLHESLKEGGRAGGEAVRRGARELLIGAEVALSVVLLVGAGLLARSLWQLQAVDPGFHPEHVLAMEVSLPTARYEEGQQIPFHRQLQERVATLAGVRAVGAVNILPLSSNYDSRAIQLNDHPKPDGQGPSPQARSVTRGYFAVMGIPLLRGRLFDEHDTEASAKVAVISDAMARAYWPGEDALGKRITFNTGAAGEQVVGGSGSREVVGIVGNVKHLGLDESDVPMFYTPHTQQPSYHTMQMVVRAEGDAASLTGAVRVELSRLDKDVPLSQVRTLDSMIGKTVAAPRLRASLLGGFAVLAMLLAAVGVYGVVAYLVGQRTREIGVRLALGASGGDVVGMVMREGLRPVTLGMGVGVVGALALTRVLSSMLYGVTASDVVSYLAACGMLAVAAVAASVVPARRALRVDPVVAFRAE